MKIRIFILILFLTIVIIPVSYSQTDSLITITINKHKVIPGKMYEISFSDKASERGKLLGVNKEMILMLIDNATEEFSLEDITGIKELTDSNIAYKTFRPQKLSGSIYSISAGYTRRDGKTDNGYYYYTSNYNISGFNFMGDVILKTSNYFGFRFDFNFIHTFATKISGHSYYSPYDTATMKTEINLAGASLLAIKPALSFGLISDDNPFNIFANVGLAIGLIFKSEDITNTYKTKGSITSLYQTYYKSNNGLAIGTFGSVRISYKISKKHSLFAEPSYQIWGNNIEHLININARNNIPVIMK